MFAFVGLRRYLPAPEFLRELAVRIDTVDQIVHLHTVRELERAVQVDLDQCPHVGLLGLAQLLPRVASRSLAVIQLVVGLPENAGKHLAFGVSALNGIAHGIELGVGPSSAGGSKPSSR